MRKKNDSVSENNKEKTVKKSNTILNNKLKSVKKDNKVLSNKKKSDNDFIKKIMDNKKKIIMIIVVLIILIILIFLFFKYVINKRKDFVLNEYYNLYPEQVRQLYSNIVDVSCSGDMHFDMAAGDGVKKVGEMNKHNLMDYMFSYLDKNNLLADNMDDKVIKKAEKALFNADFSLLNEISNYNYNGNVYTYKSGKITRKKSECKSNMQYVTHLYGYSFDSVRLSMDVMAGYVKDGALYDYNDNKLGTYPETISELSKLMEKASYYRLIYVKDGDDFRLESVEHRKKA